MNEKCPICQKITLEFDADESVGVQPCFMCTSCGFGCDAKDLPRIAAAMELARALVKLERCEVIGPEYHMLERSIAKLEYRVIEVFGGE